MPYTVWCIVIGEDIPFSVKVDKSQSVHALKGAIKKEKKHTFNSVDANVLTLYHINVDTSKKQKIYLKEVQKLSQNLNEDARLDPVHELKEVFGSPGPTSQRIHILVQHPRGESCTGARLDVMLIQPQAVRRKRTKPIPTPFLACHRLQNFPPISISPQ
jgi:Crinkler effector protein N-terminal domain